MLSPSASASACTTTYRNTSDAVPVPEAYDACRVTEPIVSANCGAPVTSTALLNVTVAAIVSPRSKVSPTTGSPIATPVTPAAPWLASTLCAAAFAIACALRLKSADKLVPPRTSLIVPPFNAKASASMLIPSESASPTATTWRNVSVVVPVPEA